MNIFLILILISSLFINANISQSNKVALSHITLLLPYTSNYNESPTRYRISSHGGLSHGCVEWSISPKHGVIEIIPKQSFTRYHHENEKCPDNTYNEAIIKAISPPSNGRVSATITAYDSKSRTSAECEVFIDKVDQLQVATSTRLIYLGKYESIAVNGFDDKGNKFATLQGIQMVWKGISKHLQQITFEEASLMLPDINDNGDAFISSKKTNNPLPVKGKNTGQEDVSVEINTRLNPAHKGCKPAKASLYVVMQLQLAPRTLYVTKCSQARFELITTSYDELVLDKGNYRTNESPTIQNRDSMELHRQRLEIPQDQYQFKLYDKNGRLGTLKMSIEQNGILTTQHILENGKLMVEDTVTSHESIENTADARIYVVDAVTIDAEVIKYKYRTLRPNNYYKRRENDPWYLTVNDEYFIRLTLKDKHDNSICTRDYHPAELDNIPNSPMMNLKSWKQKYICMNIEFTIDIINDNNGMVVSEREAKVNYAEINSRKNDNEFTIKPINKQSFTLKFTAKGKACRNPPKIASSTKKVVVTSAVSFSNTSSIFCPTANTGYNAQKLALLPYTRRIHRAPIFFEGGSGRYRLELNDTLIAEAMLHDIDSGTEDKYVTIAGGKRVGKTHLFVIDYWNPDNFQVLDVEVQEIAKFELNKQIPKEILLHESIQIPVIIRDYKGRRFSSLDGMEDVFKYHYAEMNVNADFHSPTLTDLFDGRLNIENETEDDDDDDDDDDEDQSATNPSNDDIVRSVANQALNRLEEINKPKPFTCNDADGYFIVRGIREGYDIFSVDIPLALKAVNMFVSVYKEIIPIHRSVAIAININDPYTMKWNFGPNPWPMDISGDATRFDDAFLNKLEVDVPHNTVNDSKDFSVRYNGNTLEFICYQEFHYTVQLTVSNKMLDTLPYPVKSIANIEVFCFPQFKFTPSKIEMGVGTRKEAKEFYPEWVSSPAAQEFNIRLTQQESEVVSIANSQHFVAKRLGSSSISGQLIHPKGTIHIHPSGFSAKLQIIVLFKDFSMEMAAYWIIAGNDQIAHIEGLDEDYHILPFRHNFDDVFVEWQSEDPNIIELLPILPRPNALTYNANIDERNNVGTGLSVKLMAHSVGQVNIKATIKLRNPPKKIKSEFAITKTVTVIPQVVHSCNSIILKPNSTLPLSARFNPDTTVAGIGQIYTMKPTSEHSEWIYVGPSAQTLKVSKDAPPGENIPVTFSLKSPKVKIPHKVKQYPLTQAASLIVSIVEPTGLNLLNPAFIEDNIMYSQSINYDGSSGQQFWSTLSSSRKANQQQLDAKYSKTDNILCEKQNVTLQIAILDELARDLHVMDQIKVVSNDTTIVSPRKDITIREESIGGPMYATVQLDALQPGFATITFREKDVTVSDNKPQQSEVYVYDDPQFLRTFLTIHVLSSTDCINYFGVQFSDDIIIRNESELRYTAQTSAAQDTRFSAPRPRRQDANYKNGKNWQPNQTAKGFPAVSKGMIAVLGGLLLVIIMSCWNGNNNIFGGILMNSNSSFDDQLAPSATFNPYAPVQDQIEAFQGQNPSPFRRAI